MAGADGAEEQEDAGPAAAAEAEEQEDRPDLTETNRDGDADTMKNEGLQSQPTGNAGGQVIASHFSRRQAAPFAIMTSTDQNETTTVDVPSYASDDWGDDY